MRDARSDRVYRVLMRLGALLFRVLDLRRDVSGADRVPATGGAVLAVTHFGYLDFALVQQAVWRRRRRFTRYLVTDAAFAHPLAGPLLRAMGHIPVHRAAGAGAYRMAARALRQGALVGIFPESAVSTSNELLPLKKGAAALAAETGVPLIPVVVWGGQQVMTKGAGLRWSRARHARIHLEFGTPMRPPPGSDPEETTAELRTALTAMLAVRLEISPLRAPVPETPPRRLRPHPSRADQ